MTDAESILAALEPEDEIRDPISNPYETVSTDTASIGWMTPIQLSSRTVYGGLPTIRKELPAFHRGPKLSFDDVWGDALEQANVTDESIKTLGEFLLMNTVLPGKTVGEIQMTKNLPGWLRKPESDLLANMPEVGSPDIDPHDELLDLIYNVVGEPHFPDRGTNGEEI